MTRAALGRMVRALRREFTKPEEWKATARGTIERQPGKLDYAAARALALSPARVRAFKRRYGIAASDKDLAAHLPGGQSEYAPA